MAKKVTDLFARASVWRKTDCFQFVWASVCDRKDREIEMDWNAIYGSSKDERGLLKKHRKDPWGAMRELFIKPLGLQLVTGLDTRPGDVLLVDDNGVPGLALVDDDYMPIEKTGVGISPFRGEVLERYR